MKVYVTGSLKHPVARDTAHLIREAGHEVFDDWHAGGPECDFNWRTYEQDRGRNYAEALAAPFGANALAFDKKWLDWCDVAVGAPKPGQCIGASMAIELTYVRYACNKRTYLYLFEEPKEWDLMVPLAVHGIYYDIEALIRVIG